MRLADTVPQTGHVWLPEKEHIFFVLSVENVESWRPPRRCVLLTTHLRLLVTVSKLSRFVRTHHDDLQGTWG